MEITIKGTPEEMAVLLCEPKAVNGATFNIDTVSCAGSTVDKLIQEAEFYRRQIGPLKGTGSPQENLKRVLLDVADANGIKF